MLEGKVTEASEEIGQKGVQARPNLVLSKGCSVCPGLGSDPA
jgi:hypothetical protein